MHEGDIGRVTKLDRDGLHDLNVQVVWLCGCVAQSAQQPGAQGGGQQKQQYLQHTLNALQII